MLLKQRFALLNSRPGFLFRSAVVHSFSRASISCSLGSSKWQLRRCRACQGGPDPTKSNSDEMPELWPRPTAHVSLFYHFRAVALESHVSTSVKLLGFLLQEKEELRACAWVGAGAAAGRHGCVRLGGWALAAAAVWSWELGRWCRCRYCCCVPLGAWALPLLLCALRALVLLQNAAGAYASIIFRAGPAWRRTASPRCFSL